MTPQERAKKMLPFVQAMSEGKKIEYRYNDDSKWLEAASPIFNFDNHEYRIKAEPRVLWIVINRYGEGSRQFSDEAKARKELGYFNIQCPFGPYTLVKFVEELEN